jgi:hypothetical protein
MRSSVASNTAESKPLFPFCFSDEPFSTTETAVFESVVEVRRALVFNLGLAKGFNCSSAQSESTTLLVRSHQGRKRSVSDPFGELSGGNRFSSKA